MFKVYPQKLFRKSFTSQCRWELNPVQVCKWSKESHLCEVWLCVCRIDSRWVCSVEYMECTAAEEWDQRQQELRGSPRDFQLPDGSPHGGVGETSLYLHFHISRRAPPFFCTGFEGFTHASGLRGLGSAAKPASHLQQYSYTWTHTHTHCCS